jgi:hypothetical protein
MLVPKFCVLVTSNSSASNVNWWSQAGSNRRPPACKAGALPSELWPPDLSFFPSDALRCSLSRSCTVCTLPPSLSSRLADEKKSCVSVLTKHLKFLTSFFDALPDSFRKSNKDSPFCSDQGGGSRRISLYASGPTTPSWAKWWVWEDLNFRPHPYQGCALTN